MPQANNGAQPKMVIDAVEKGLLSWIPLVVAALVVAHLLAFGYWIYRLASDRPPGRRKTH